MALKPALRSSQTVLGRRPKVWYLIQDAQQSLTNPNIVPRKQTLNLTSKRREVFTYETSKEKLNSGNKSEHFGDFHWQIHLLDIDTRFNLFFSRNIFYSTKIPHHFSTVFKSQKILITLSTNKNNIIKQTFKAWTLQPVACAHQIWNNFPMADIDEWPVLLLPELRSHQSVKRLHEVPHFHIGTFHQLPLLALLTAVHLRPEPRWPQFLAEKKKQK